MICVPDDDEEISQMAREIRERRRTSPPVFLVVVSKKGKRVFRRLHKRSLPCGKLPDVDFQVYEEYAEGEDIEYDDFCHLCWRDGDAPPDGDSRRGG